MRHWQRIGGTRIRFQTLMGGLEASQSRVERISSRSRTKVIVLSYLMWQLFQIWVVVVGQVLEVLVSDSQGLISKTLRVIDLLQYNP